jgi:DNA-binding response OmpR family regulator
VSGGLRWATGVDQATAYFQAKPPFGDRLKNPPPSLVLLDIQLVRGDGFELLSWVRAQSAEWRRIPVIMLTTSNDRAEINRAYDLGANSYLVKPTGFDELCRMIGSLSEYWLKSNRGG